MRMSLVGEHESYAIVRLEVDEHGDPSATYADMMYEVLGEDVFSKRVLLDMSALDYIISEKIGWLVKCNKMFNQCGGTFILFGLTPMVRKMLMLMQLNQVLTIADRKDDAEQKAQEAAAQSSSSPADDNGSAPEENGSQHAESQADVEEESVE